MARAALSLRFPRHRNHSGDRPGCDAFSGAATKRRFAIVAIIFAAAFGTLALSFWPYMIPFSITIEEAAAPHSSLAFMFWGAGLFVFPLMLLYNGDQLQRVQRQNSAGSRSLLITTEEVPQ